MKRVAFVLALAACDRSKAPEPAPAPVVATAPPAKQEDVGALGKSKPAPERVVAIGDLHGDLVATRAVLRLAGAIDDKDSWSGGKLVLVQTGDEVDRGDDDRKIVDFFERLKAEAPKAGGEVIALVGNHEIMNAQLDFRYVTDGGYKAFADVAPANDGMAVAAAKGEAKARGRSFAFLPGGLYAKILANRPVIARVGDSLFVHGGILPKHLKSLDAINDGTKEWLLGDKSSLPKEITAEDGPLWTRMYSAAPSKEDCAHLFEVLDALHAKRLVMGHTPQKPDVSPACGEKAWRIDTGMSKFYSGKVEALELEGDSAKVLRSE